MSTVVLPKSYTAIPLTQIRVSHHPLSSTTPTPILILTLYRPGRHNAFTDTMLDEILTVLNYIKHDERIRCLVLTGHGNIFCAGADLESGFGYREENAREHRDGCVVYSSQPFLSLLHTENVNRPNMTRR